MPLLNRVYLPKNGKKIQWLVGIKVINRSSLKANDQSKKDGVFILVKVRNKSK